MSFEHHITLSDTERGKFYEFDLHSCKDKQGKVQVKIGNDFYSIETKSSEDVENIKYLLQKIVENKSINTVEDLLGTMHSLSSLHDVKTSTIHHLGVTTLTGTPPRGEWSKQEQQLKQTIATLYWEQKVISNPKNTHEDFIECIRLNAKYDPTIDNEQDKLVKKFLLAIKNGIVSEEGSDAREKRAKAKEEFLQLFESLPLGVAGTISHGEGLNVSPPSPVLDVEKKSFTANDLAELQQYMKDVQFSGVVCLSDAQGNTHTLSSHNVKNDTSFAMHSIGKMFTGILTMKMIEMKIISKDDLDKPIQLDPEVMKKLPEKVRNHLTKNGAPTFQEIMLHKSGLKDYLTKYEAAIQQALDTHSPVPAIQSPDDFLKYADMEIVELAGDETHYSNLGLLLVGLSIQHHYNKENPSNIKTYQELLQNFILDPAGLSSFQIERPKDGCYNELHTAAAHVAGGPAGGYWITPMDLLKFGEWTALQCKNESFYQLVQEYGGEFTEPKNDPQKKQEFSQGSKIEALSHGGEIESATSFLGTFPQNGLNVAILSNRPLQASILEGKIRQYILSKKE